MITDEKMRSRIKRFWKRKSQNHLRYYANSFGKDYLIWKSLCALYTQERIEKNNKRYLRIQDFIWLIAMKQYMVESGADKFFMKDIRLFMNYNFKTQKSAMTSVNVGKKLMKAGYLAPLEGHKRGYILTMKARAFYTDLSDLFSI